MKKIVLVIAALLFMAVPVMAVSTVTITCSDDDVNCVTLSYSSNLNRIRAFALDINVAPEDCNIKRVDVCDANYRIYPGQIEIVSGEVSAYGTPYAIADLNDANITVEMGSLYTLDANYASDPNAGYRTSPPGLSGTLLKFYVSRDCDYKVDVNVMRGGIVMEDPCEEPIVTLPCSGRVSGVVMCTVPDVTNMTPDAAKAAIVAAGLVADGNTCTATCGTVGDGNVVSTSPVANTVVACGSSVSKYICECYCGRTDYAQWVTVGKPKCWCYPRQCKGDADGLPDGKNNYWVSTPDLTILKSAWLIANGPVGAPGACADFDHLPDGKNNYRVSTPDLAILKSNWLIPNGPTGTCLPGNRAP
jgi:hypothetical protein